MAKLNNEQVAQYSSKPLSAPLWLTVGEYAAIYSALQTMAVTIEKGAPSALDGVLKENISGALAKLDEICKEGM